MDNTYFIINVYEVATLMKLVGFIVGKVHLAYNIWTDNGKGEV